jgi:transposase
MSLRPRLVPDIPEETTRVAKAAFPKGNPYMTMRDQLGTFFTDDQFVDLYPANGQLAFSPWRLALICVMQFAENLSDRQAADAVRARIDWKYALSLDLEDKGFDHSVLCEFRQRLLASKDAERLLNSMLMEFKQRKLLKARGKQRTDATHVLSANRLLNRLELVGETLHYALNQIATYDPDWLKTWVPPIWFDRYGRSFNEYRLPTKDSERDELAITIGRDGMGLLDAIYNVAHTPSHLRDLKAIEVLRHTWVQQYWMNDDRVCWRAGKELPPCGIRLQSPYETDARYSTKRSVSWVGYKAHLTETCDEDTPHLITHVQTTAATVQDVEVVDDIHRDLEKLECLPDQHITDMGYSSAGLFVDSWQNYKVELIAPVRDDRSWQFREGTGFDVAQFEIDWENKHATCPMGKVSSSWTPCPPRQGHEVIFIKFRTPDCRDCQAKPVCTKAKRRTISVQTEELYDFIKQKRAFQQTDDYWELYRQRAGVEGTISQAAWGLGMRQSRYRGLDKTHLQNVFIAAAINLTRAVNWLIETPLAETRISRFSTLAA